MELNKELVKKVRVLRQKAIIKKKLSWKYQLDKPVSFWIKPDRLLHEVGKEFTIILRTRGCNWALGDSGGCSMCGYIQDSYMESLPEGKIKQQFDFALQKKIEEIENDNNNYILKIFNSGSFFDNEEVSEELRRYIYEYIASLVKIKEVVVESRVEYISNEKITEMRDALRNKYCEIGIGLETIDDYIRNNYVNKGISFNEFQEAAKICQEQGIGVKAYLLFKPPFLSEQAAIDDCSNSIKTLIKSNINSISINPLNIQKGSLAEYLWFQNRYRLPWFYSLFKCIKKSLNPEDLKSTRILCDPSGAGTKRGIHNCLKRECNENMRTILQQFVLDQDVHKLKGIKNECNCKILYQLQKDFW